MVAAAVADLPSLPAGASPPAGAAGTAPTAGGRGRLGGIGADCAAELSGCLADAPRAP